MSSGTQTLLSNTPMLRFTHKHTDVIMLYAFEWHICRLFGALFAFSIKCAVAETHQEILSAVKLHDVLKELIKRKLLEEVMDRKDLFNINIVCPEKLICVYTLRGKLNPISNSIKTMRHCFYFKSIHYIMNMCKMPL